MIDGSNLIVDRKLEGQVTADSGVLIAILRYADGNIANKEDRRSEFWLIGGGGNR